ncbi:hypothetical protein DERF_003282 [Dermatophagoides farinae]|uniref:Uncharacterized protein n=1 Tax=Dermatophagoides farinae TaxID=6954 RepID=A0A922IFR3_DERFA|nr:hypothetical protein DERF_003282 [Dermatophagoides farinae]
MHIDRRFHIFNAHKDEQTNRRKNSDKVIAFLPPPFSDYDKKSGTHLIMLITIRENKMLMKAM